MKTQTPLLIISMNQPPPPKKKGEKAALLVAKIDPENTLILKGKFSNSLPVLAFLSASSQAKISLG